MKTHVEQIKQKILPILQRHKVKQTARNEVKNNEKGSFSERIKDNCRH